MALTTLQSSNFQVQYDSTEFAQAELGRVQQRAQALLTAAEPDYATLCGWFGIEVGAGFGPTNRVIITLTKSVRGASNNGYSTNNPTMSVNPELGSSDDYVFGLFVAEMIEILMTYQGSKWNPSNSGGEGLSRVAAEILHPAFAPQTPYAFVDAWLASDPTQDNTSAQADDQYRKDWISTNFTGGPLKSGGHVTGDDDTYSYGAAILFIYYLKDQLGYSMPQIVQNGAGTLDGTYRRLTNGHTDAYAAFRALVDAAFPIDSPKAKSDNPFPIVFQPKVFYRGTNKDVLSRRRNPDGSWSDEQNIGGILAGDPIVAVLPGSNIVQLFYRGADNGVWSRWRNPDGSWSDQQNIGGILAGDPIAAVVPGTNILQLFYRGADDSVWSRWRNPDGSWSDEQNIGGVLAGDPIAAVVPDTNILQLFYRGADNSVWSRRRNPDGSWSDEQKIGGVLAGDPVAAMVPGTNILQLFYRGADNSVWSRWRNSDGSWSDEQNIGGILAGDPIAAVVPNTNILQLFYRGADNGVWSRWRDPDGSWSDEQKIGGALAGDPIAVVAPGSNTLRLFYRGADNSLSSLWRNPDGSWPDEQKIGGVLTGDPIAVVLPG